MGYVMNEEQRGLRDTVRAFLSKELSPIIMECDEKNEPPMHLVRMGIEMGLHLMDIPEEYGGMGLDDLTTHILIQEICRFDVGFAVTFALTAMSMKVVLYIGNEEQKQRVGRFLASGKIGAFCLTEPQGGSDAANMRVTAVKNGDSYILNGTKCFITNGEIADIFVVMAVTDKSKGAKGISAFIVEGDRPGISVGKHENKIGMRLSPTNDVVFTDVVVPKENLLGEEGLGFLAALKFLYNGRVTVASLAMGIAQRALEESVKYAKMRVVFGEPIANYQGISFMISDMAASIEACRSLIGHTLALKAQGLPYEKEASMCKLLATDAAMKITTDAVQIFGGYGLCKDYPVEKLMRDAKILQIVEGANQIQRTIIAKRVMKEYE